MNYFHAQMASHCSLISMTITDNREFSSGKQQLELTKLCAIFV